MNKSSFNSKSFFALLIMMLFSSAIYFQYNRAIEVVDNDAKIISSEDKKIIDCLEVIDLSAFTAHNYNVNLTRIIFELYLDILPNGQDIFATAHFTYQNAGEEDIYNIVHVIDLTTILGDSRISSIITYDAFGDLGYKWTMVDTLHLVNVSLREAINPSKFYSFTISYLLEDAIVSSIDISSNYIAQWTVTHDESIEQFSLILTLPIQYSLFNQSGLDPIPDYKSPDARRLQWDFYNILAEQSQTWIIRFQVYVAPTPPTEPITNAIWFGIAGAFVGGLLIGGIAVFFIIKSRRDSERKEIVETLLSKPEKDILKIIKEQEGMTTQSKITNKSGFSKAKVSYYLTELEKKKIISRERWGRMNRIKIIDDTVDKVYFAEEETQEDTE